MLLASLLLAASWTTILPLVETVAVSGIRRGALDYGKVRLWGRAQGISDGMIGVLWSVGVVAEVALFALSHLVLRHGEAVHGRRAAATFRRGLMAIDLPLCATVLLQTLHAMSFGAAHI